MKKSMNETFVTVYRFEINSKVCSEQEICNFVEAISVYSIVVRDIPNVVIITVCNDSLNASKLHNIAIQKLGTYNYESSVIGLLGPFKKSY